ncbi:hypothetical protein FOA52_016317 [Chlamydomonas sp. UWO 241]|nr:hypothetical protein FOA52_016317 [Chlamydomonas sp. UWO 241]
MLNEGNAVLVDIRTQAEKEVGGVPDLPGSLSKRCSEVEFITIEDRKLRGMLRDPRAVEATATALQIASLRSVSQGTSIVLMDRNCASSQQVAKELGRKGFTKVFVMSGGFDGRTGWVQTKLAVKPAATRLSFAPPGKTISTRPMLPAPRFVAELVERVGSMSTRPGSVSNKPKTVSGSKPPPPTRSKSASTKPAPAAQRTASSRTVSNKPARKSDRP